MALSPIRSADKSRLAEQVKSILSDVRRPSSGDDLNPRVMAWLDQAWDACRGDIDRLNEAVSRLSGFSGNELGVAVAEYLGSADSFESMREIVSRKLLISPPVAPNYRMQVAQAFKEDARLAFLERFAGHGCVGDAAVARSLETGIHLDGSPVRFERPWMGPSMCPHGVFVIAGRRYLVDFKISLRDNAPLEAPTRNIYQLHAEKMFVEAHGYAVDGLIVAKYTPNENDFFELLPLEVEYDPEKSLALIEAGDRFWSTRCAGDLPPPSALPRLDVRDVRELRELANQFASCDAIASQAYREGAAAKNALLERLSTTAMESGMHGLGPVSVQVTKQLDVARAVRELGLQAEAARGVSYSAQKMAEYLKGSGVDMAQFAEPGALDESKLRLMLKEKGLQTSRFEHQVVSLGLDRRPNGLGSELKRRAANDVLGLRDKLLSVVAQGAIDKHQPAQREVGRPVPGM